MTLDSGAGVEDTFYVKAGATLNFTGGGSGHEIFFEPGATINGSTDSETRTETCITFDTSDAPPCP